jgi:hypothetical protein
MWVDRVTRHMNKCRSSPDHEQPGSQYGGHPPTATLPGAVGHCVAGLRPRLDRGYFLRNRRCRIFPPIRDRRLGEPTR